MDRTRVRFTVEVNLDPVPGWGDNKEDWQFHIQQALHANDGSGYNITVSEGEIVHEAEPLSVQLKQLAEEILNNETAQSAEAYMNELAILSLPDGSLKDNPNFD